MVHRNRAKAEGKNVMKSGFVYRVKADQDGFIKSFEDGGYKSRFEKSCSYISSVKVTVKYMNRTTGTYGLGLSITRQLDC